MRACLLEKIRILNKIKLGLVFSLLAVISLFIFSIYLFFSFQKPPEQYLKLTTKPLALQGEFSLNEKGKIELEKIANYFGVDSSSLSGFSIELDSTTSARLSKYLPVQVFIDEISSKKIFWHTLPSSGQKETNYFEKKNFFDFLTPSWLPSNIVNEKSTNIEKYKIFDQLKSSPKQTSVFFQGDVVKSFVSALYPDWPDDFWRWFEESFDRDLTMFFLPSDDGLEIVATARKNQQKAEEILDELPEITKGLKKGEDYETLTGPAFRKTKIENISVSEVSLPVNLGGENKSFSSFWATHFNERLIFTSSPEVLPLVFSALREDGNNLEEVAGELIQDLPQEGNFSILVLEPKDLIEKNLPSRFLIVPPDSFQGKLIAEIDTLSIVSSTKGLSGKITLKD